MDLEPLRDGHGRVIGDLRVSVTDRCNFRCQYCMPAEGLPWLERAEILSFEEIARLVQLFAGWRPPINVPVMPAISIDTGVMIFAALASLVTGIVFGLAPALQSTKAELAPALKNEAIAERIRKFAARG